MIQLPTDEKGVVFWVNPRSVNFVKIGDYGFFRKHWQVCLDLLDRYIYIDAPENTEESAIALAESIARSLRCS